MKPYYEDDLVTLYHGDCRELAEWQTADVLVTDPPYGMSYSSGWVKGRESAAIAGDGDTDIRDLVLGLWGDRPAICFGTWRVPKPLGTRQTGIWDKGDDPGMGDLKMPWGSSFEEFYILGSGFVGKRGGAVIRAKKPPVSNRPDHPTPKPIGLMESLIEKCPPGVIADPFAGSGATLIAARNLGRRVIGVELEERYCELTAKRLSQQAFNFAELGGE
ncbi:DNA methyltransferase [Mycetocola saprophilus]|uniref:DNA methyltransferase n=1 Tax=Mycetocola saprophilus TaxID=76636 RepID=UPI003BF27454